MERATKNSTYLKYAFGCIRLEHESWEGARGEAAASLVIGTSAGHISTMQTSFPDRWAIHDRPVERKASGESTPLSQPNPRETSNSPEKLPARPRASAPLSQRTGPTHMNHQSDPLVKIAAFFGAFLSRPTQIILAVDSTDASYYASHAGIRKAFRR